MSTLTITLPLPPKECSPNSWAHWSARCRANKRARNDAKLAAFAERCDVAKQGRRWEPPAAAGVALRFYWPTNRKRDRDNAIGSCKAYMDGLTDAHVWTDDAAVRSYAVEFAVDKARPRVEITIRALDAGEGGE